MQIIDWMGRLIAFDTTSRGSNLQLIDMLSNWFKEKGLPIRLTRDPKEQKANLVASLPDQKGNLDGGIVLSGHTDTVPVDGQAWDTNPFEAVVKDGLVYGRGTCDMKGFLAVCLSMVPEWQQQRLPFPVHLAFSYDEEVGCRGAPLLIEDLIKAGIRPKACIVGEPSMMKPVVGHKGIQGFRCRVKGVAAHSSLTPKGVNAIEYAARLICAIRNMADEMKAVGPFDHHFDVPYTTFSTNTISGGTASNIIPADCDFGFEFRHLPGVEAKKIAGSIESFVRKELKPAMERENKAAHIQIDNLAGVPAFECAEDSPFTKLVWEICGDKEIHKVAYATEAGLFEQAKIATIVCGPGSIEQAHRPNEFVAISQLEECRTFLQKLMQGFTSHFC